MEPEREQILHIAGLNSAVISVVAPNNCLCMCAGGVAKVLRLWGGPIKFDTENISDKDKYFLIPGCHG